MHDNQQIIEALGAWVRALDKSIQSLPDIGGESGQRRLQKFLGEDVLPFLKALNGDE
jgi:hypothetical protein